MNKIRHPYTVRQTTSGRNGVTKYLVFFKGSRVSVHAHASKTSAQLAADELNIVAMVRDFDEDPRPYAVRHAEAKAIYESGERA